VRLWGSGLSGFANKDLHNPISAVGYASTYSQKVGLVEGQKSYGARSPVLGHQGVCLGRECNRLHQPGSSQYRLTLHSRGGPTACHQARATECGCSFSVARAWRPTVGLPLSSNVRQRTRTNAVRQHFNANTACRCAVISSVAVRVAGNTGSSGQNKRDACKQRSAHVLRRSRDAALVRPQI
jgi:hypothetical protein